MRTPLVVEAFVTLGCTGAAAKAYERTTQLLDGDFFSRWTFFTAPDPSGGNVRYVNYAEAMESGMAKATGDRVYLGVDMAPGVNGKSRRSVRIQSKDTFNGGLFVLRLDHIPTGCGTWPAFWMYGEDADHVWPSWGEYDIIEGVHERNSVMTSLHTTEDCDQSEATEPSRRKWMATPDGLHATDCNHVAVGQFENQGCSQLGPNGTIGSMFNRGGGGTFAAEWDPDARHIRTWFWPMGTEPVDLLRFMPDSDTWGSPYSYFSLNPWVCSTDHFANMRLVFDITLCGAFADATFAEDCPAVADTMTCKEYTQTADGAMSEAYWSIRAFDIYQARGSAIREPSPPKSTNPHPWWLVPMLLLLIVTMGFVLFFMRRKVLLAFLSEADTLNCPVFYRRCLEDATFTNAGTDPTSPKAALQDPLASQMSQGLPRPLHRCHSMDRWGVPQEVALPGGRLSRCHSMDITSWGVPQDMQPNGGDFGETDAYRSSPPRASRAPSRTPMRRNSFVLPQQTLPQQTFSLPGACRIVSL